MNCKESKIQSILIRKLNEAKDYRENPFIGKVNDNYWLGRIDLISEVLLEIDEKEAEL